MTLLLTLALSLAPQGPDANLLGAGETVFVDAQTAGINFPSDLKSAGWLKRAGAFDGPPDVHPSEFGTPDFSPGAAPWNLPGVEIDGFSTNLNWIVIDANGRASAQGDGGAGWAGIAVSVTRGTEGEAGSTIAAEMDTNDGGATTFQYVFPDSQGLPGGLPGNTLVANDAEDIRLIGGIDAPEKTAFDLFVPLLYGQSDLSNALRAEFEGVYFSLTSASANSFEHGGIQLSGADIWASYWVGGHWTTPFVRYSYQALNLQESDEIAGLAWDSERGRLLFSSPDTPSTLNVVDLTTMTWGPLHLPDSQGGGTVSEAIGLCAAAPPVRIDDIDAVCAFDPRLPDFTRHIATPHGNDPCGSWGSMFRRPNAGFTGDEFVAMFRPPVTQPQFTWLTLQVAAGSPPAPLLPPIGTPAPLVTLPYTPTLQSHSWPAAPLVSNGYLDAQWIISSATDPLCWGPWLRLEI
ncbi:MAG: hypothetical protein AAF628_31475 [Planctomycetota bacterium]